MFIHKIFSNKNIFNPFREHKYLPNEIHKRNTIRQRMDEQFDTFNTNIGINKSPNPFKKFIKDCASPPPEAVRKLSMKDAIDILWPDNSSPTDEFGK